MLVSLRTEVKQLEKHLKIIELQARSTKSSQMEFDKQNLVAMQTMSLLKRQVLHTEARLDKMSVDLASVKSSSAKPALIESRSSSSQAPSSYV
jgi:hypothetical protein